MRVVTAALSLADTVIFTVPETVAPAAGDVMLTDRAVESAGAGGGVLVLVLSPDSGGTMTRNTSVRGEPSQLLWKSTKEPVGSTLPRGPVSKSR